ncbi:SusD/RagB family nutrient-binding outer membrane lipoprotein [Bacteroidota bacterium]
MKNTINTISILSLLLILLFTSCESWIDPEINKNPDEVTDVPPELLLPGILGNMAYTFGGFNVAGVSGMWTQQITGGARQAIAMYNYNIKEENVADTWDSFYPDIMMNIKVMMDKSTSLPHYSGVSKVLMAVALGNCTNLFGDVPYLEAFQGDANLTPKYDFQEEIFNSILGLLGEAITELQTPAIENPVALSGDMIYGDNTALWLKAAYTLRARYRLNISEKTPDWDAILNDLANGISSNDEDMEFYFGDIPSEANPLYNFNSDRDGYILASREFKTMLKKDSLIDGTPDPRYSVFTDENNQGLVFGTAYGRINSPVVFTSYVEAKFIEAEAHLRKATPSQSAANAAYRAAVSASLAKFNVSNANWEALYANPFGGATREKIGIAKFKALFLQAEAYTNYRRTGYPVITAVTGTQVPSRLPYPTDERLYNPNRPADLSIFTKMWWMP